MPLFAFLCESRDRALYLACIPYIDRALVLGADTFK
jgi:hypothetical protein